MTEQTENSDIESRALRLIQKFESWALASVERRVTFKKKILPHVRIFFQYHGCNNKHMYKLKYTNSQILTDLLEKPNQNILF